MIPEHKHLLTEALKDAENIEYNINHVRDNSDFTVEAEYSKAHRLASELVTELSRLKGETTCTPT